MKYKYWLANINGLWNGKRLLLYRNHISAEQLYYIEEKELENITGLTVEDIEAIKRSKDIWDIDKEWTDFCLTGFGFVTIEDNEYPIKLREIFDPPYCLFYKGNLPKPDKKTIAIVGARGRSAYGESVAKEIAKRLAVLNVDVISGMARGIDRDGHLGAIDGGGNTFAVLGCGIDVCYPVENKFLYDKIPNHGGIISEYPLNTPPLSINFPRRNRIISGLSDGVIVVEAKIKSGSLITADYALEQGKDIYVVPGRITDTLSQGCNALVKQGACIISSIDEFINELCDLETKYCVQMDFRKNILEKQESLVYSLLDFRPIGIGTIMETLPFQLSELLTILEQLESKGFIRETIPNYYVREL